MDQDYGGDFLWGKSTCKDLDEGSLDPLLKNSIKRDVYHPIASFNYGQWLNYLWECEEYCYELWGFCRPLVP